MVDYYLLRVNGNLELLEQLDLIGRTSELARLFGIQFFEVLSRGSQFRVESLMLRMTKRRNNVPVSPSIQVSGVCMTICLSSHNNEVENSKEPE